MRRKTVLSTLKIKLCHLITVLILNNYLGKYLKYFYCEIRNIIKINKKKVKEQKQN